MENPKKFCKDVVKKIYSEIDDLPDYRIQPHLAIVQIGDDPSSTLYIKFKRKACEKLGFKFTLLKYDDDITTEELCKEIIMKCNENIDVTGCIVQLPLPETIDTNRILHIVKPEKDVDGFHYVNFGKMGLGFKQDSFFVPATALGIYKLIKYSGIETKGKMCVVIGKSNIVGKPIAMMLSNETDCSCTVAMCDKYTEPETFSMLVKSADILIVAAGKYNLINDPDMIKPGAFVVDVGIHKIWSNERQKYLIRGDVDHDKIKDVAAFITPVPGGVGPMTVASLMLNLARSAV
jgi:methylenetetrahydrofolate dehydrogenase (NADP+)/methenyltetrahydrofolate cyclohydrolase